MFYSPHDHTKFLFHTLHSLIMRSLLLSWTLKTAFKNHLPLFVPSQLNPCSIRLTTLLFAISSKEHWVFNGVQHPCTQWLISVILIKKELRVKITIKIIIFTITSAFYTTYGRHNIQMEEKKSTPKNPSQSKEKSSPLTAL